MPEVRRASPADATAVHEVLAAAFEPLRPRYTEGAFAATVTPPDVVVDRLTEGPVWVAVVENEVVGTVAARIDDTGCYVRGMGVHPATRGLGVGAALLQAVEAHARVTDARRLWLLTTDFLHPALRLYERSGFSYIPTEANLFGTPLISMEKRLH